jgi:hypothetical protein
MSVAWGSCCLERVLRSMCMHQPCLPLHCAAGLVTSRAVPCPLQHSLGRCHWELQGEQVEPLANSWEGIWGSRAT